MKIPKKIVIGTYQFNVTYHDELYSDHDGERAVGKCNVQDFRIQLINNMSKTCKETTFIHECLEAINHIYGIGCKHKQIEALESGVYQLIRGIM